MKKAIALTLCFLVVAAVFAGSYDYGTIGYGGFSFGWDKSFMTVSMLGEKSTGEGTELFLDIEGEVYFSTKSDVGIYFEMMSLLFPLSASANGTEIEKNDIVTFVDQQVFNVGLSSRMPLKNVVLVANAGLHYEHASLDGVTARTMGIHGCFIEYIPLGNDINFGLKLTTIIPVSFKMTYGNDSFEPSVKGATLGVGFVLSENI